MTVSLEKGSNLPGIEAVFYKISAKLVKELIIGHISSKIYVETTSKSSSYSVVRRALGLARIWLTSIKVWLRILVVRKEDRPFTPQRAPRNADESRACATQYPGCSTAYSLVSWVETVHVFSQTTTDTWPDESVFIPLHQIE